jgi:hypothetical protein
MLMALKSPHRSAIPRLFAGSKMSRFSDRAADAPQGNGALKGLLIPRSTATKIVFGR